ncbi:DUF4232 domain-containing protein [Actinophytocola oryzae]|uniref:Uncharacterized protein DUF4232 n=1 Tax=Actinophytocola oryzae TaxID=502181 RepID=A0A4R7W169_9PSEU|nr:DUF4232 domain-containing protein [Actinophytocola oryzae]TDV56283.1 uncharacterized protein DUF4232 [Actinophytocola oryzae]
MWHSTVRKGFLIAGGVTAAVVLAGCGQQAAESASPDGSRTSTATSDVQAQAETSSAPAANSAECKVADLTIGFGQSEGAAGTIYRPIIFTNKGTRTCTMQGFPGVSYVAGDDGHQVGPGADHSSDKLPAVTLKPGDSANSSLGVRNAVADDPNCQKTAVRGLRVYPPDEYDSMFLASEGTACAGTTSENQLTISSIEPGTSHH